MPGFGDPHARLLLVGLAPGAHGANRTGRVFTGDRSGDWLYRALYETGFSSRPSSRQAGDGLVLQDCYISAAVRCVPPDNRPSPEERTNCLPYLGADLRALVNLQVIVGLGSIGWEAVLRALRDNGDDIGTPKPRFGHEAQASLGRYTLIGSYHPSPHNTSTGRLSWQAFQRVFVTARERLA